LELKLQACLSFTLPKKQDLHPKPLFLIRPAKQKQNWNMGLVQVFASMPIHLMSLTG